jgi:hypothetical protein
VYIPGKNMAVLGRFVDGEVLLIQRCPPLLPLSRRRWHRAQDRERREASLIADVKRLDIAGYDLACLVPIMDVVLCFAGMRRCERGENEGWIAHIRTDHAVPFPGPRKSINCVVIHNCPKVHVTIKFAQAAFQIN